MASEIITVKVLFAKNGDLYKQLSDIAKKYHVSVSSVIESILRNSLKIW